MASTTAKHETSSPPPTYSLHNIGRALFDMNIRFAKQDKELLTQELEFAAFARQQHVFNKRIEESLATLAAIFKAKKEPPDPPPAVTMERVWQPPPSLTQAPPGIAPAALPRLRVDPPRFDRENAVEWICNMQIYYNHHYTPLDDRLYLTKYLFDHPASEWMAHWMDNNAGKGWDDFLFAVKQRFDPDLYEDSVAHDLLPHSPGQTRDSQALTHATSPLMQQHAASQSTIPTSLLSEISQPYREFPVVRASATQDVEVANSKQVINKSMAEDIGASPILSLINVPSDGVVLNDDVTLDISRNVVVPHPRSVMQVFVPPNHHMASCPLPEDQPNPSSKFGDVIETKVGGMVVPILFDSGQPAQIDAFLAVKSAQIDPHYVATSTPSYGDYYMESHLQKQALLCVADRDLFRFKQPLTSDGRSIPPRNVVTCLESSCSILLYLMGSYHGDSEWSCATLRFGGDDGARIFDPGVFKGVETIQVTYSVFESGVDASNCDATVVVNQSFVEIRVFDFANFGEKFGTVEMLTFMFFIHDPP